MDGDANSEQRKRAERLLVREGLDLWRARQQQLLAKKAYEQQQLREMLLNYSPWGRPGGGAPNSDTVRKRKALQVETLYGDPSAPGPPGMAPPPVPPAPLAPLQASHTLPRVQPQARRLRCDPLLLFQFQEADRRAVDNLLRYRTDHRQKEQYRLELDRLVQEKRRRQQEQQQRQQQQLHHQHHLQQQQLLQQEQQYHQQDPGHASSTAAPLRERNGGGVELVPLLDRRRYPPLAGDSPDLSPGRAGTGTLRTRAPLSSTDVTKLKEPVSTEKEGVWRDLAQQIDRKKRHLEALRAEELERCRRHFETWQLLWGRPGHGAPRDVKVKENLDVILYHLDNRNRTPRTPRGGGEPRGLATPPRSAESAPAAVAAS